MTTTDAPQPVSNSSVILDLAPLSPTIGAVIQGIDLGTEQTQPVMNAIRQALLDWKVIFFRNQDITTEQHLAFGRAFGELEVHPFAPHKEGHPEVLAITHDVDTPGFENIWHSDVTWRLQPSLGSILRCIEAPEVGGDTLFSDMGAAYDGLPEEVREQVEGRVARHDFAGFRRGMRRRGATQEELEEFDKTYPNPEHPVVRTHPETERQSLYVNEAFTQEIVGFEPDKSDRLLQILYRQASFPEYQCRFDWEPNSIAFWDNRACQHYATSDYWPAVRRVERVTVIGDTPYYEPTGGPSTTAAESPIAERRARYRGILRRQNGWPRQT